jgi:uncharacterized protein with von Willebrand factor type A (vWA) domain
MALGNDGKLVNDITQFACVLNKAGLPIGAYSVLNAILAIRWCNL